MLESNVDKAGCATASEAGRSDQQFVSTPIIILHQESARVNEKTFIKTLPPRFLSFNRGRIQQSAYLFTYN